MGEPQRNKKVLDIVTQKLSLQKRTNLSEEIFVKEAKENTYYIVFVEDVMGV